MKEKEICFSSYGKNIFHQQSGIQTGCCGRSRQQPSGELEYPKALGEFNPADIMTNYYY